MDALLSLAAEDNEAVDPERSAFQQLKMDPGRVGIDGVFAEITKLRSSSLPISPVIRFI